MKKLFLILLFLFLLTKIIKAQNGFDSTDMIIVGLIEFENPIFVSVTNAPYLVCDSINLTKINFYYPEIACFDTLAFQIENLNNFIKLNGKLPKNELFEKLDLKNKSYNSFIPIQKSYFIFLNNDDEYKCRYIHHSKFIHIKMKYRVYANFVIDSSFSDLEWILPIDLSERYFNLLIPIYE